MKKRLILAMLTVGGVAFLSACGGGGDGSSSTGTPAATVLTTTNPDAAFSNFLRTPRTYQLGGTAANGAAVSASLTVGAAQSTSYQGDTYDLRTASTSVSVAGAGTTTSSSTYWLLPGTTQIALIVDTEASGNTCDAVKSRTLMPVLSTLGATGPLVSGDRYSSCSKFGDRLGISIESFNAAWTFKAVNGLPFVCLNMAFASFASSSQETCIQVLDAAGTVGNKVRVTVTDANKTTTVLSN